MELFAGLLVLGAFGAMGKSDATVFAEALQQQGNSRSVAAEVTQPFSNMGGHGVNGCASISICCSLC
jgi:hypothetical protein